MTTDEFRPLEALWTRFLKRQFSSPTALNIHPVSNSRIRWEGNFYIDINILLRSNRTSRQASAAYFHSMSWIRHEEFKSINITDCFPHSSELQGPANFLLQINYTCGKLSNSHHPSLVGFNYSSLMTGDATVQDHFYHMRNRTLLRIRCFLSYKGTTRSAKLDF